MSESNEWNTLTNLGDGNLQNNGLIPIYRQYRNDRYGPKQDKMVADEGNISKSSVLHVINVSHNILLSHSHLGKLQIIDCLNKLEGGYFPTFFKL